MKIFTGIVTSTKMAKTAKVSVERIVAHPVYKKRVKRSDNYLVHDEMGAQDGQQVRFIASRPYSKMKRWKIIEIVGVKKAEPVKKEEKAEKVEVKKTVAKKPAVKKVAKKTVKAKK